MILDRNTKPERSIGRYAWSNPKRALYENERAFNSKRKFSDTLAASQIIFQNPILNESDELKRTYFAYLEKCIRLGNWKNRKIVKAQLMLYSKMLTGKEEIEARKYQNALGGLKAYKYLLFFDLFVVMGYDQKAFSSNKMQRVKTEYSLMMHLKKSEQIKLENIINAISNVGQRKDDSGWRNLKGQKFLKDFTEYIERIETNLKFISQKPYSILVTATMSAGKSTFLNAITGQNISRTQNLACTSKIHSILGKPVDDGITTEYDYDLVLDAEKEELLEDHELNEQNKIIVSTYYKGELGGKRLIINDSPGVNYSENEEHKRITNRLIKAKRYNLLIYVMNATQLGTNDDDAHLEFVRRHLGRRKILFVINKIDAFNIEEENVEKIIEKQTKYLESKGFKDPIVCPVSSRAAFLAKKCLYEELNRVESRELDCYIVDFEQMKLPDYYAKYFPEIRISDEKQEEKQLLKTCGVSYIEKIIDVIRRGGK